MKALRQAATPRNYEVWYAYATGYHPSLNQTDQRDTKGQEAVSPRPISFRCTKIILSPTRLTERIDLVGSQVKGEIDQVMAMIDAAVGSATSYTEILAGATEQLVRIERQRRFAHNRRKHRVQTTKTMEISNRSLEERLHASKQEINDLQENLEAVRTESLTDPLTQLANRKFFDSTLEKSIAEAVERNEALSLMLTDIDHFKTFNDSFGHLTGDQVLRLVAMSVKHNVKGKDTAARYGGEEFAVILPNTTLRAAVTVAEHIRRAVMAKELMKRSTGENLGRMTISIGVATLHKADTGQPLIDVPISASMLQSGMAATA